MSIETTQGYGSAEWQKDEVTSEKALQDLDNFTSEDILKIKNALSEDMEVDGISAGAQEGHIRQVLAIGHVLANGSGKFDSAKEQELVDLCIMLHDPEKTPASFENLFTHAAQAAGNIPIYLKNLDIYGSGHKPLRELVPADLQQKLANAPNLALFISKVVETHSAIPYIDNAFRYESLADAREKGGDYVLPYLVERTTPTGERYWGLPEPTEDYGKLLRAADTLSNYGLIPELQVEVKKGEDPTLAKYSGFIKLLKLEKTGSTSEKILRIKTSSIAAIDAGIYDDFPVAKNAAEQSVVRADWLATYFKMHDNATYEEAFSEMEKATKESITTIG